MQSDNSNSKTRGAQNCGKLFFFEGFFSKMSMMIMMTLCALRTSSATNMDTGTVKLHILPHTHADVGWLETVDALSRMNVSRILDGVTGNREYFMC